MKKVLRIGILTTIVMLTGCGAPGDPLDDFYTRNVYPGTASTYSVGSVDLSYSDGYFDNVYIAGTAYNSPAYGEIYITTPLATTITLVDTYYLVLGTTTSDELQGFTASNGRLTYTGAANRVTNVVASMAVSSDINNVLLGTKLYKNGVGHDASFIQRKIATAGDIGAQSLTALLTLSTGDYIEIYITSDKAADITFNNMSLTAVMVD